MPVRKLTSEQRLSRAIDIMEALYAAAEEHAAPDAFANQLLAALALLAVCAWLGNIGKNNKMFYIPMIFMLIVTLTSLAQTISTQVGKITAGAATDWAPYAQAILGVLLFILAIVLAVEGCMTIFGKKKNTAAK